jgi:uncharacterized repeat protein (TIGR01451 family)
VTNPGGTPSSAVSFNIAVTPPVPNLTSAFPSYSIWGLTGLFANDLLYVSGSGFEQGMTLSWNGANLGAVGCGIGLLCVNVPSNLLQTPGPAVITAANPGGAPSAPVTITIPLLRTLTSISPATVPAGGGSFTLTVNGAGFASVDAIAIWPGSLGVPTTFVSPTQLQALVPASVVASDGTLQVWVDTNTTSGDFHSINELPMTVGTGGPVLSISKTHSGDFIQGQLGAAYSITVSNASGAGPTIGATGNQLTARGPNGKLISGSVVGIAPTGGAVTVTEALPAGLTLVSMAGTGWSCTIATASCTRSDVLLGGASYPPLTVTVNVSSTASSPVTNSVSVSGGGSPSGSASDITLVIPTPDLTINKMHSGNFQQGQSGATYTITVSNSGAGATSGTVTVTDALPASLTATAISGPGWNCALAILTCTRSDALIAGSSYPAITLTLNVATNAPPSVTNVANVSGGGEVNTTNDQASDVTTILGANIAFLFPDTAVAGSSGFTLSVSGSGFQSGSVIDWNGTALPTTFSNSGLVTATVSGSLIASAGTASIDVRNPGGTLSKGVSFNIVATPVAPSLTSAFPSDAVWALNGYFAKGVLFLGGSGFQPGAVLSWKGASFNPAITLGQIECGFGFLSVYVPAALLRTPGPVVITATNPGGKPSAPVTVNIPVPRRLESISPASVPTGSAAFTLTVNGAGFTSEDTVAIWPGSLGLPTTFLNSTQLQVTVPASLVASDGRLQVWINSAMAGGVFHSINELPLAVGTGGPLLSVAKAHSGNFTQGQQNVTYSVTVSNASGAGPTTAAVSSLVTGIGPNGSPFTGNAQGIPPASGPVTLTEFAPRGLTLVSMSGTGWGCTLATASCTRSDVAVGGASYPVITVTANVSSTAPPSLTNSVAVSGGGSPSSTASDVTAITLVPDLIIVKTHQGNFAQGQNGAVYTVTTSNIGNVPTSGSVTVTDTLPSGLTATAISGPGWSCVLAPLTCTRNDALAAGSSYPAITLMVNVASTAPTGVTNIVTVAGGGEANTSNDTASDPTTISATTTHRDDVPRTGVFVRQNGDETPSAGAAVDQRRKRR